MAENQEPWLSFLDDLDCDPERAWKGFYVFAWKLLRVSPPRVLGSLTPEDREDVFSQILLHCCKDSFANLRKYRNTGKPFAAWLTCVARNWTLDWIRVNGKVAARRRALEPENPVPAPHDSSSDCENRELLEVVLACIKMLGEDCQILLHFSSLGLRPREITIAMGWPPDWNKKASDDLRACRERLRRKVADRGIDLNELP